MIQPTSAVHQNTSRSGSRSKTIAAVVATPVGSRRWCARCPSAWPWTRRSRAGTAGARPPSARPGIPARPLEQLVVPVVPAIPHRRRARPVARTTITVSQRVQAVDFLVHGLLDGGGLAAPPAPSVVMSALASRDLHPLPHRGRREAAEHHVVRRADPGAGQHGHHDLGDHRQVDADDVALPHAASLQRVRQPLGVGEDLGVRQGALSRPARRASGRRPGRRGRPSRAGPGSCRRR